MKMTRQLDTVAMNQVLNLLQEKPEYAIGEIVVIALILFALSSGDFSLIKTKTVPAVNKTTTKTKKARKSKSAPFVSSIPAPKATEIVGEITTSKK